MSKGEVVSMFCVPKPVGCGKEIPSPKSFRDQQSLREYMITGICQECQDDYERTAAYAEEEE